MYAIKNMIGIYNFRMKEYHLGNRINFNKKLNNHE